MNDFMEENLKRCEEESCTEEYLMESSVFDYSKLKSSENFGIKKY